MSMQFSKGQRVVWEEGSSQITCAGTIVNEEKHQDGTNPLGFWNIRVDQEHRFRACRTAYECNMGWVSRCVAFNNLRPEGT